MKFMLKKIIICFLAAVLVFGLTGCIKFGTKEAVTTDQGGVFVSGDKGETWVHRSILMTAGAKELSIAGIDILSMALDPSDTDAIYIGTRDNGVFYSYNGAEGWTQSLDLISKTKNTIYSLAVDPFDKCTVFAGAGNKIYKSEDCSRTWKNVFTSPKTDEVIRDVLVDWYNSKIVYAAARDGSIYKSETVGESWVKLTDLKKDIREMEMDANDSRVLYVATRTGGIYKSVDSGLTWINLKDKLEEFSSTAKEGFGLEVAQDGSKAILYLSKYGLLKSVDQGETWVKQNLLTGMGEVEFFVFAIDPNNSKNIYMADAKTLYRTTDGSQTWQTKELPTNMQISTLKVHLKDSNLLFTGFKAPVQ